MFSSAPGAAPSHRNPPSPLKRVYAARAAGRSSGHGDGGSVARDRTVPAQLPQHCLCVDLPGLELVWWTLAEP